MRLITNAIERRTTHKNTFCTVQFIKAHIEAKLKHEFRSQGNATLGGYIREAFGVLTVHYYIW